MANDDYDYGAGSLFASMPLAWKLAKGIGRAGMGMGRSITGSPLSALGAFMYGMGDGKGNFSTAANAGEQAIYKKDGSLNLDNPMFKLDPKQFMTSAQPNSGAAVSAPPASPSPSPQVGAAPVAPVTSAPLGPAMGPQPPPQASLPRGAQPSAFAPTQPPVGLYNGPGSMNFGAGDQAPGGPGGGTGGGPLNFLSALAQGDKAGMQRGNGLIPKMLRAFGPQTQFNPGWFNSNAWYNN